jgi:tellurite resistance protein TerC
MIAGASWVWWVGFHAVVAGLLAGEWLIFGRTVGGRHTDRHTQAHAWLGTAALVAAAVGFAGWLGVAHGRQAALEFVAGYTIESSLSIDNLFVFMVLFQGFKISRERQHKALLWGVAGAVILRGLFVAAGVGMLQRFQWINYALGLFLLYTAVKLVFGGSTHEVIPEWIRKLQPAKGSLLPVIVAIEVTDLLFATDSIPAVLAVSHNPFVVYTSNIAAVLGLRSLYFALAAMLGRLKYLHYGLGAMLGFVALKMLAARWVAVPIMASLAVMGTLLAVCAAAEWAHRGEVE